MNNKKIELEYFPEELAQKLYTMAEDMDCIDYLDTKEQTINELINALYYIKTLSENNLNPDYFRTLYRVLEGI